MKYAKILLSEMRMVVVSKKEREITDESLARALTLNENLKSFGFTFMPKDLIEYFGNISKEEAEIVWHRFKNLMPNTSAEPMYPDFPSQVLEMNEAEFRLHQMIHYFTTYGIESLTGEKVDEGWLPKTPKTEKTEEDISLLKAKTLEPILKKEMYNKPFKRILQKTERMTDKEVKIIEECVKHLHQLDLNIDIAFKENLTAIFIAVMNADISRTSKILVLKSLCQHTGDVWKCLESYLTEKKWHLKTSEKRTIVKLLESYPAEDFRANLIITNKKANRVITLLEFLSYNRFSGSEAHKEAVFDLRNGSLHSWQSVMHTLIADHDNNTVSYMGARPGILLRNVNWLLKEGYDKNDIADELCKHAAALSAQTLVNVITDFNREKDGHEHADKVSFVLKKALIEKMRCMDVPFERKKVFIDWKDISPENSVINKSEEGGYVRSGLAIKLPESGRYLRFFTYWNDEHRIDIDLHAFFVDLNGNKHHVGWYGDFNNSGIVHSGDITHSNAAEFIDIDLENPNIDYVDLTIHSYTRVPFMNIDTVYTGLMSVSEVGKKANVELYNQKNVLWSHDLTTNQNYLHYGKIDVQNRLLILDGSSTDKGDSSFTLDYYFDLLFKSVNASAVDNREDAEIVLVPYKAESEKEVSILDNNYFLDC